MMGKSMRMFRESAVQLHRPFNTLRKKHKKTKEKVTYFLLLLTWIVLGFCFFFLPVVVVVPISEMRLGIAEIKDPEDTLRFR